MKVRESGILLHITSLPSPYGIGDLGSEAYRFVDLLVQSKQSYWQILPLSPIDPIFGNSPYNSPSAFAGNTLLISPDLLLRDGLLHEEDVDDRPSFPEGRVDYSAVTAYKKKTLCLAYDRFNTQKKNSDYPHFCMENFNWLEDFALFVSLKNHFHGEVWSKWPKAAKDRNEEALSYLKDKLKDWMSREKFFQYIFFKQWLSLKRYCNDYGIKIIGDLPLYVNYDSADVWANREIFNLDEEGQPISVAGVPPDYFSQTGQLWGNPTYKWHKLKEKGYDWWIRRINHSLNLFDILRIDHFRGLIAYWEVEAGKKTAAEGRWVEAPAEDFITTIIRRFSCLPVVAEDLGQIASDVRELMGHFEIPGMRVLLFAFGVDLPRSIHIPHNYGRNCVAYTGTHDTNTVRGWFEREASPEDRLRLFSYLGGEVTAEEVHWEMIRLAMMSVADVAIMPMQDILGLGEETRMNRPGTANENYLWRMLPDQLKPLDRKLREMTEIYGRA